MAEQSRLQTLSPALAKQLRAAADARRVKAVRACCLKAVGEVELHAAEVDVALDLLREGKRGTGAVAEQLAALAQQLDDRYFELSDDGDAVTDEALRYFGKARAAAALAFALSGELHEALYEAASASADPLSLLRIAEAELGEG